MVASFWNSEKEKQAYYALKQAGEEGLRNIDWERSSELAHSTFDYWRKKLCERDLVVKENNIYKILNEVQLQPENTDL